MNATQASILVIEDDPQIQSFLRATLEAEGYRAVGSDKGRRGLVDAGSHKPDMAIVDLGLPDMDGVEVIRGIRAWSTMPILVLSARSHERSKVEALDAGADDYLTKPFGIGEFLARVRAALRHAVRSPAGPLIGWDDVRIDLNARHVTRAGEPVRLTQVEFRLLAALARRPGMVVTHRQLLTEVWGPAHVADTHYLRVYMKQLRDKLEQSAADPRHLRTELGVGYRLVIE